MSHASSSSIKEKEIQKKRNIKSRKIDKRKRKRLVFRVFHNSASYRYKVKRRGIKVAMKSVKMKNVSLGMFYYKTKFFK